VSILPVVDEHLNEIPAVFGKVLRALAELRCALGGRGKQSAPLPHPSEGSGLRRPGTAAGRWTTDGRDAREKPEKA